MLQQKLSKKSLARELLSYLLRHEQAARTRSNSGIREDLKQSSDLLRAAVEEQIRSCKAGHFMGEAHPENDS